jgi:tetratricopeptide (TPR) repeat protein
MAIRPFEDERMAINMSVWESLDALQQFVYRSEHLAPLRDRSKWFEPIDGPILALWWVPAGHVPTVAEAADRLKLLKERGPSRDAFTFRQPFPPPEDTMKHSRSAVIGLTCFLLGLLVQAGFAQAKKLTFTPDLIRGKDAKDAASALLDGALQLAGDGSWERIAVGRAWYLGGDKTKGQAIFDGVTGSKKAKNSDWFRVGRVYVEAGEWDKAQAAFDKALAMAPDDDSGMIEYGALANVHKDRAKAEELFEKAMKKNPREIWHWANAGGSYLGVRPQ